MLIDKYYKCVLSVLKDISKPSTRRDIRLIHDVVSFFSRVLTHLGCVRISWMMSCLLFQICWFPKMGGTPKSSISKGFSIINHDLGYPYFRKPPYPLVNKQFAKVSQL